jgi:hypothetical protein
MSISRPSCRAQEAGTPGVLPAIRLLLPHKPHPGPVNCPVNGEEKMVALYEKQHSGFLEQCQRNTFSADHVYFSGKFNICQEKSSHMQKNGNGPLHIS